MDVVKVAALETATSQRAKGHITAGETLDAASSGPSPPPLHPGRGRCLVKPRAGDRAHGEHRGHRLLSSLWPRTAGTDGDPWLSGHLQGPPCGWPAAHLALQGWGPSTVLPWARGACPALLCQAACKWLGWGSLVEVGSGWGCQKQARREPQIRSPALVACQLKHGPSCSSEC